MVQVDLPAAFAVGQVFGLLSKRYLKIEHDLVGNRLLGPANVYFACGFAPAGLFLLIGWPAWEVMYATDGVEKPFDRPLAAGFYVGFLIAMVLLANLGFGLAHHWYRKGRDLWVAAGCTAGIVLTVAPFLLKWGVWFTVGDYQTVTGGGGRSFWEPPFILGWGVLMSWFAVTTVLTGWWLRRRSVALAERG